MELIIFDIAASIIQSVLFAYTIIYCLEKKEKIDKIKLFFMIIAFVLHAQIFTKTFGDSLGISVFATHILGLCITTVFYRKNILEAVIGYSVIYFIMVILNITFGSFIFECINTMLPIEYTYYEKIFIVYIPESMLLLLCFKYIYKIKQFYILIINEGFSRYFLIMSFFLDFVLTFYLITLGEKGQLIKNIIYVMFFLCIIMLMFYFGNIHKKSKRICKLNDALEMKNSELRRIKHDYGSQISYIYGLCLMERFDDLKRTLKDIINNEESTQTSVEISNNEESILSLALKPAIDKGIHVIIEDKCDFDLIKMNEMEFYRVVSNIVNNAIIAMKGEGIIIAKSYECFGNMIIKIENNGPKIHEEDLENIFKMGFTTKDNNDKNHGYGLSIVKELVESYNGKIHVKSNDSATEFKIVLPI